MRLFTYLLPAMRKLVRRDEAYARVRRDLFTEEVGRRYFRELSIDELPGRTTPETLALCLAMAEALGAEIHYVAPAIGFQKNFPYPDNGELAPNGRGPLPRGAGLRGLDRIPLGQR